MSRKLQKAVLGLLVLAAAATIWSPARAAPQSDHANIGTPCENCHSDRKSSLAAPPLPDPSGTAARLTGSHRDFIEGQSGQGRLCAECHAGATEAGHPIEFVPERPLPPRFPLGRGGEMTCTTCHDLAEGGPGATRTGKSGRAFCLSCHAAEFFAGMADGGESLVKSGHLNTREAGDGRVDRYSERCMDCHPGNVQIGSIRTASKGFLFPNQGENHPIGSDYGRFWAAGQYRPAASLPEEIMLPEGKVSCLSCHRGYSARHGQPVRAGDLCMDCHEK